MIYRCEGNVKVTIQGIHGSMIVYTVGSSLTRFYDSKESLYSWQKISHVGQLLLGGSMNRFLVTCIVAIVHTYDPGLDLLVVSASVQCA